MSQSVSKYRSNSDSNQANVINSQWKKPILVAFHGAAATTYGFAICWQNVSGTNLSYSMKSSIMTSASSAASAELFLRTNPMVRVYGKWRFLTYNCLVMQFVAYSLCFTSHFVPKLRRPKDFFFTTFAFPIGMLVVGSFWAIWFTAGREYIFPIALEPYYPPWLNHITHTIIAPINLAELLLVRHNYSADRKAIVPLVGYILSYTSYLLFIRYQTGRFVYPFLNKMDPVPVGAFITGMAVFTVIVYKSGKILHEFVHGAKAISDRIFAKSSSAGDMVAEKAD